MFDISDHGGVFSGAQKKNDYPIVRRRVGSESVKAGDYLAIEQMTGLLTKKPSDFRPIFDKTAISEIPMNNMLGNDNDVMQLYPLSDSRVILFKNNNTKLSAYILKVNKQSVESTSPEHILLTFSTSTLNRYRVVKLSETKFFVWYVSRTSSAVTTTRGMIIDVSGSSNPVVISDAELFPDGADNNVYHANELNTFKMQNGSTKIYYVGARSYGGMKSRYIDINAQLTSVVSFGTYSEGDLSSSEFGYARIAKFLILSENSVSSTGIVATRGYVNSVVAYFFKFKLNHDTNVVNFLPIYTSGQKYLQFNTAFNYGSLDDIQIADDKSYIVVYSYLSVSQTPGVATTIILFRYPLNGNGELSSLGNENAIKIGVYEGVGNSESIRSMSFYKIEKDKYLINFAGINNASRWDNYYAVIDVSKVGVSYSSTFYKQDLHLYTAGKSFANLEIQPKVFLQFGTVREYPTNVGFNFIDLNHIPMSVQAIEAGEPGQLIDVYQFK